MKKLAKITVSEILFIIYRICRAFTIWYEMDEKK